MFLVRVHDEGIYGEFSACTSLSISTTRDVLFLYFFALMSQSESILRCWFMFRVFKFVFGFCYKGKAGAEKTTWRSNRLHISRAHLWHRKHH